MTRYLTEICRYFALQSQRLKASGFPYLLILNQRKFTSKKIQFLGKSNMFHLLFRLYEGFSVQ